MPERDAIFQNKPEMPMRVVPMAEALSNVPDKHKEWISSVWRSIAKGKKVNPKYQHSLGQEQG